MLNMSNFGMGEGRITKKPVMMANKDGSKKAFVTLAVQDNFASGTDKERKTQFLNLEGFVPKDRKSSVYEKLCIHLSSKRSFRKHTFYGKFDNFFWFLV